MLNKITLPRVLTTNNIDEVLSLCSSIRERNNLVLDAQNYTYASPIGLTLLKAAIHSQHPCRVSDIEWMETTRASYLSRMNFFVGVSAPSVEIANKQRHDRTDTLVELNKIHHEGEVDDVAHQLSNTLTQSVIRESAEYATPDFDSEAICNPIRYLISEILLNSTTHAKRYGNERSKAWVAAQALKATPRNSACIEIAIVDDGCGVLQTLADQLNDKNSTAEAIELAMTPYVSCNFGVDFMGQETTNQGVGLYVAKDMILQAGGRIQIISDNCMFDSSSSKRSGSYTMLDNSWNGVAISLTIPFDRIHEVSPTLSLDKIHVASQSGTALNFS